jgi:signal transduction histidine kinase
MTGSLPAAPRADPPEVERGEPSPWGGSAARRFWQDTLFKRLFALLWVALVVSHLAGFLAFRSSLPPGDSGPPLSQLPALPSLAPAPWSHEGPPPAPPPGAPNVGGPPAGPPPQQQPPGLWLDYLVRALIIGGAAWWGARWLSAPMRRLAAAAHELGTSMGRRTPAALDERRGTVEVREAAVVFNRMARKLHEQFDARGLFMAAISHDLRTPLTRARLRLEQRLPDPLIERCIADLREMDELLDGVLDALRDERASEAAQPIDVFALLQALCDDLAEQGHMLRLTGASAVARAQPSALKRVLGNLLSNALRYGDGPVEVALTQHDDALRITIDDHGPGIPQAQLRAVFEPFVRLETSRSRATGGVGLGLHIARELALRNGAQLTLANRPEGGLRAELTLQRPAR